MNIPIVKKQVKNKPIEKNLILMFEKGIFAFTNYKC